MRESGKKQRAWGRLACGLVAVHGGAVRVGAVQVGATISCVFPLPTLFSHFFIFQEFSWTCVGGLGDFLSQNEAKHTNLLWTSCEAPTRDQQVDPKARQN